MAPFLLSLFPHKGQTKHSDSLVAIVKAWRKLTGRHFLRVKPKQRKLTKLTFMISRAQCKEKSTNAVQHIFPASYHKYSLHIHKEMKVENIIQEHSQF